MAHFRARRRWQAVGVVGLVTVIGAGITVAGAHASETATFSDDFESSSLSDWSKSGGSWSIVSDSGSQVLSQTNAGSENAREFAGDTSWTDYTVSAKVKPLSLDSDGFVGLLTRAKSSTTFYRLALLSGKVQLQEVKSGTVTVLAGATKTISTGTWYTLSITTSGSTVSASIDGTSIGSGTSSVTSAGRIGVQTGYATANFDDVTVSTGSTSTPTTTTSSASTTTSPSTTTTTTTTSSAPVSGDAIYVSPKGSDSASGTSSDPTTLATAITEVDAGGTIYLRGGTYSLSKTQTIAEGNDGTASALKTISAYPGETPVLDFSAMSTGDSNRGIQLYGDYWHLVGFTVQYAGDNGIAVGGSHNTLESMVTAYNQDSGVQISRVSSSTAKSDWPADNLVISSESHDNADPDGEDADGFAAKLTVGEGNVFRYDVSHNNIDDGWDLYSKTDTGAIAPVTIEDSLSYDNGTLTDGTVNDEGDRNGFKLGGSDIEVDNIVKRNIAYNNGHHGFTYNSNPGSMTIDSNLSIDNAERNYAFDEGTSVFTDNTSCRFDVSGSNDKISGTADSSNQFWTGSNGSRCSSYDGKLSWSFDSDGTLVTKIGGTVVSL